MKYEITVKDNECSPMVPGTCKLESGDIVLVTDRKNKTTHTFIVVEIDHTGVNADICGECDVNMAGRCIIVRTGANSYDSGCAAPDKCVFRSIDKMMENL